MKKHFLTFILFSFGFIDCFSQLEKSSAQFGVSVLPVLDVFKVFPDNKISGFAVIGNIGFFPIKNLSAGIQPYYGQASNSYSSFFFEKENQEIKLYGLNAYLRYYFIRKQKFLAYSMASVGFGNSEQKTTLVSTVILVKSPINKSVLTGVFGAGIGYFIVKNLALELNIQYLNIKYFSADPADKSFHTIAPTVGVEFFLK